jgi:hypothetical protein
MSVPLLTAMAEGVFSDNSMKRVRSSNPAKYAVGSRAQLADPAVNGWFVHDAVHDNGSSGPGHISLGVEPPASASALADEDEEGQSEHPPVSAWNSFTTMINLGSDDVMSTVAANDAEIESAVIFVRMMAVPPLVLGVVHCVAQAVQGGTVTDALFASLEMGCVVLLVSFHTTASRFLKNQFHKAVHELDDEPSFGRLQPNGQGLLWIVRNTIPFCTSVEHIPPGSTQGKSDQHTSATNMKWIVRVVASKPSIFLAGTCGGTGICVSCWILSTVIDPTSGDHYPFIEYPWTFYPFAFALGELLTGMMLVSFNVSKVAYLVSKFVKVRLHDRTSHTMWVLQYLAMRLPIAVAFGWLVQVIAIVFGGVMPADNDVGILILAFWALGSITASSLTLLAFTIHPWQKLTALKIKEMKEWSCQIEAQYEVIKRDASTCSRLDAHQEFLHLDHLIAMQTLTAAVWTYPLGSGGLKSLASSLAVSAVPFLIKFAQKFGTP